jgi:hypothetical protein
MSNADEPPDYLLNRFAQNEFSQTGEDGIIARALEIIGQTDGWCVEFGGWDGLHFSNTARLLRKKDYAGIFIEANPAKFAELTKNYRDFPKVKAYNQFVGFSAMDNLDTLLAKTAIPEDFDLLSIDIDGNDYHVWAAIKRLRPKLVVIEFNPTIPNEVDFVQEANPRVQQGSSIAALNRLAKEKGYELICANEWNGFFVDRKYFSRFEIPDNSIQNLRRDLSYVTYIFSGFDGRMMLAGNKKMPWHDMPMDEARAQQLPVSLIGFPDDYSPWQRRLFKHFRKRRQKQAKGQ